MTRWGTLEMEISKRVATPARVKQRKTKEKLMSLRKPSGRTPTSVKKKNLLLMPGKKKKFEEKKINPRCRMMTSKRF